jgi:hypothetical protein
VEHADVQALDAGPAHGQPADCHRFRPPS